MKLFGRHLVVLAFLFAGINTVAAQSPPPGAPGTTTQDPMRAKKDSCIAQNALACFELGNHYRNKKYRSAQDALDEQSAFGRACKLKHAESCFKFAEIYENDMRTVRDPKMALRAYGLSCELKFGDGCFRAATIINRASVPPEQNAQRIKTVQTLYKAGCDLKNANSCQAIGLASATPAPAVSGKVAMTAAETAEAAFQADSRVTPELIVKKASDVKPSYTGYLGRGEDLALQNATSTKINAAVENYTRKMVERGYELHIKSYIHPKFSSHSIPLTETYDYAFFSACNENCTNLKMTLVYVQNGFQEVYMGAADKASAGTSRWFTFSPTEKTKSSGFVGREPAYKINVRALCSADPCTVGQEAAAQFVVYRRVRMFNIEATPTKP